MTNIILYFKSIICKLMERQNDQSAGGGDWPAKVHAGGQRKGIAMGEGGGNDWWW